MGMNTDEDLVGRAAGGDQDAMSELYERYFDRVVDFLTRLVHDRAEAADIAQDTFIKAMTGLGGLSSGASFKGWVFTIARNTALNRLEKASRVQPLDARAGSEEDATGFDVVDTNRFGDPEEAFEARRLAALVWDAARALEPRQYSVLDLNVRQGFSGAELAAVLGVSTNNAYVMVNRMKRTLQEAIGALALLRQPFRRCRELDAVLAGLATDELTPEVRRAIDRHTAGCAVCNERRRTLASPFAILGGFTPLVLAPDARARITDAVAVAYRAGHPIGRVNEGSGSASVSGPAPGVWPPSAPTEVVQPGALPTTTYSWRKIGSSVLVLILLALGSVLFVRFAWSAPGTSQAGATESESVVLADANGAGDPTASATNALGGGAGSSPTPAAAPPSSAPALADQPGSPSPTSTVIADAPGAPSPTSTGLTGPTPPTPTASLVSTPSPRPPARAATPRPATLPPKSTPTPTPSPRPTPTPTSDVRLRRPTPTPTATPACSPSLVASPNPVLFGSTATQKPLTITASRCRGHVPFGIVADQEWLSAKPASGALTPGTPFTVQVTVDRTRLSAGTNVGHLVITSGTSTISVTVEAIGAG